MEVGFGGSADDFTGFGDLEAGSGCLGGDFGSLEASFGGLDADSGVPGPLFRCLETSKLDSSQNFSFYYLITNLDLNASVDYLVEN